MSFLILLFVYIGYLALKAFASWEYDYFNKPKITQPEKIEPLFNDVLELDKSGPRFQRFLSSLRSSPTVNFVPDGCSDAEERNSGIGEVLSGSGDIIFKRCRQCPRIVDVRTLGLDLGPPGDVADCAQRDSCFGPDKIAEFLMNNH